MQVLRIAGCFWISEGLRECSNYGGSRLELVVVRGWCLGFGRMSFGYGSCFHQENYVDFIYFLIICFNNNLK